MIGRPNVMAPKVSVVIPTYNNASLLPETLDGVMRQSFQDFELIVVDDGSTDDTAQVVKNYEPEMIYCYQDNLGPAAARNRGASIARGDYIAFCDHDDVWNERHLEVLLGCFASHPCVALAFDNARYFGDWETESKLHIAPRRSHRLAKRRITPRLIFWEYPIASMSVIMVKKDVFDRAGKLNERIMALDDYHFYLRLAAVEPVRFVNYIGCRKRVTAENLSHKVNIREANVRYLEDIWQNNPAVVRVIGSVSFRLRLSRKYFKLGRYHRQNCDHELAKEMFWKAYRTSIFSLRYLWHAVF